MSNKKDAAEKAMDSLADAAPIVTFIIACLAFACILLFKTDYYTEVFSQRWNWYAALGVGFVAALAAEGSRAILLVLTFRDFRSKNNLGGGLGLVLSFALVGYEIFSAGPISQLWTGAIEGGIATVIVDVVVFLIVLSAGLELRLALSSRLSNNATQKNNATQVRNTTQRNTGQRNETLSVQHNATAETQRNTIGFRSATDNRAELRNELTKAENNLRAYKSKLRKAREEGGNIATQQRGYDKWSAKVAELQSKLELY